MMPVDQKFLEWKGLDAKSIKDILGKTLTFYGEQDFPKQAINKKTNKPYTAIYHLFFVVDKITNEKMKFFGSDNLNKAFQKIKDKVPFDDSVEFVEGGGQYKRGYYKFKNTKPPASAFKQEPPESQAVK